MADEDHMERMMPNVIKKARKFAEKAHRSQVRKYTGEPYVNHPITVALLVHSVGGSDEMFAAALLHDVVENTEFTMEDIASEFGGMIGKIVEELTDVSRPEDGNRKVRRAIDRRRLAKTSKQAKTIKLADLIDNTRSIIKYDSDFAKIYVREKDALLKVLGEGNQVLFRKAKKIIEDYYKKGIIK